MKSNMNKTDKWIRLVAGLLVGATGIYFHTWWGLIGAVLVATSFINWCPIYAIFGISTKRSES